MYETITKLAEQFINSIQNTGIFVVKSLSNKLDELKELASKTYSVNIENHPKTVSVKGTVVVGNQAKLEKKISELNKLFVKANKTLSTLNKVEVTNQKDFPNFPESIKVSNLSDKVRVLNLNPIVDGLEDLNKEIKKIKLNPEIKVSTPKVTVPKITLPKQPTPIVNLHEKEVDLSALKDLIEFWQSLTKSAKKSLSVRLTDGKKFYKAVDEVVEAVTANNASHFQFYSGGEARPIVNRNSELTVTTSETWDINNSDKVSTTLEYIGEESVDGKWRIRKISKSGTVTTVGYASIKNNTDITDYEDAWEGRIDLIFGRSSEI